MAEPTYTLEVENVEKESEKAFLFIVHGEKMWMPKSQIRSKEEVSEGQQKITGEISEWIAGEKGLIGNEADLPPKSPQPQIDLDDDVPF